MALPSDLQDLYTMYQQEIHAATYTDNTIADLTAAMEYVGKLPPISSRFTFDNLNNDIRIPNRYEATTSLIHNLKKLLRN